MNISKRFKGCILAGAIGDAYGSAYENLTPKEDKEDTYYLFGEPKEEVPKWRITDDTQLTLATCETMVKYGKITAENLAKKFVDYYKRRKITGVGASTLKAMRELEVGGHWSLVGRKGEHAAGNGAAMRIVALAFQPNVTKQDIRDICAITHHNDEAYTGALAVYTAIKAILNREWTGQENLLPLVANKLPDTLVRDRLLEINQLNNDLDQIAALGNTGYVVDSVPLAIFFASKVSTFGMKNMFTQLIKIGGDTDTNCSIAGQIAGTLIGEDQIPPSLLSSLKELNEYTWMKQIIDNFVKAKKWEY